MWNNRMDSNLLRGIQLSSLGFTFWLLALSSWKVSNLRSKSKTVNQDYISILISASDESRGKDILRWKKKIQNSNQHFWFPLLDSHWWRSTSAKQGACLCKWVCSLFFYIFVNMHGIFRNRATQERTRARGRQPLWKCQPKFVASPQWKAGRAIYFWQKRGFAESAARRAPTQVHTAALTASVSFGTLADAHWTHTHTHFYTERGMERKKVRDYRIRSQHNMKLDYIPFNRVSLFYRAVTFSGW